MLRALSMVMGEGVKHLLAVCINHLKVSIGMMSELRWLVGPFGICFFRVDLIVTC